MKEGYLHFTRLIKDRDTGEEEGISDKIEFKNIQCLYKDRNGTWLVLSTGYMIKTAHTMSELEGHIFK